MTSFTLVIQLLIQISIASFLFYSLYSIISSFYSQLGNQTKYKHRQNCSVSQHIIDLLTKLRQITFSSSEKLFSAKVKKNKTQKISFFSFGNISSPSPIFTNRGGDAIKGDMIDSQSQLNGSINRKENMSNPTIKLVETVYQPKNEEIKRDEFQVEDDPLSPHIVYLSFNPKTISQLKE